MENRLELKRVGDRRELGVAERHSGGVPLPPRVLGDVGHEVVVAEVVAAEKGLPVVPTMVQVQFREEVGEGGAKGGGKV